MRALIASVAIALLLIAAGYAVHAGIWGHPFSILALAIWGLGDHDRVDSLDVD